MLASIIIALDSGENFTRNFLYFLSNYESIENYEIIFISDGNNEIDYKQIISEFIKKNYIYIGNKQKQGYSIVNNIAVQYASSDILIFMNSDIILCKNCLECLIDAFSDMNIDAVQPLLIYPQNMLTQSTGHVFCQYYNTHLLENRPITDEIVKQAGYRKSFTTALCSIRKNIFEKYGGFDTKYFNAWEGMELGLKITSNGGKCFYNPQAKAYHIRGGGRGQYKIDETPQTAYFWSNWGDKISENLSEILNIQFEHMNMKGKYFLLNFSSIKDFKYIFDNFSIHVYDSVNYTELSGNSNIEFFKTIPYFWLTFKDNILYLANNYTVIKNNKLWYDMRKNNNDLIIDLAGNCIKCI